MAPLPTEEKTEQQQEQQHDHDHEHPHEHAPAQSQKTSRGEKKFKKAMMKLGLKPVEDITRVTLRTQKNFVMYIDEPFVMRTGQTDNAFVIFGEPKFLDFNKQLAEKQAEKFTTPEQAEDEPEKKLGDIKEDAEEEDDTAEVEQGDLSDEDIKNLMSYVNCSRNKAIKTLQKTGGDLVEAITMLS